MQHEPLVNQGRTFDTLMACIFEQTKETALQEEEVAREALAAADQAEREASEEEARRRAADIEKRLAEEAARQARFARAHAEAKRAAGQLFVEADAIVQAKLEAERVKALEQKLRAAEAARLNAEVEAAAAIARIRSTMTIPAIPAPEPKPTRHRPSGPATRTYPIQWVTAAAMTAMFVFCAIGMTALTFQEPTYQTSQIHTKVSYEPMALGGSVEGGFVAKVDRIETKRAPRSSWRARNARTHNARAHNARARAASKAKASADPPEVAVTSANAPEGRSFKTLDVGANPFSAERF